jgi:hypothetical protein
LGESFRKKINNIYANIFGKIGVFRFLKIFAKNIRDFRETFRENEKMLRKFSVFAKIFAKNVRDFRENFQENKQIFAKMKIFVSTLV